eukprot:jgi/Chlat1/9135/Chrsp97S09282
MASRWLGLRQKSGPKEADIPSLKDACLEVLRQNASYLTDVGDTDSDLLTVILTGCDADTLERVQRSTTHRDLSAVLDRPWREAYRLAWGKESVAGVVARAQQQGEASIDWRTEYKRKDKEQREKQERSAARLRQLYSEKQNERKNKQIVVCNKNPPTSKRRHSGGGSHSASSRDCGSGKGLKLKKLRAEFASSREGQQLRAMRATSPAVHKIRTTASTSTHKPSPKLRLMK